MTDTLSRTNISPDATSVRPTWPPYVAVAAGMAFLLESALILGTKDDIASAPMVVLYFVGIASGLAAAVGFGLRQRRGRRTLVAVGLSLLLVAWITALGDLLTPVFELFSDAEYVGDEGPVAVLGVLLLAAGAFARTRDN